MYLNYLSLCLCFNYVRSINIFSVHLYKMNFKADLCKMTQSYLGHNILSGSWSTIISALLNGTMVFDGITGMMVGSHPYPSGIPTKFPSGIPPHPGGIPTKFPSGIPLLSQRDPTGMRVGSHPISVGSRPNFPVGLVGSHWDLDWDPTLIPVGFSVIFSVGWLEKKRLDLGHFSQGSNPGFEVQCGIH